MKKAMILRAIILIFIVAFTTTACTITAGTDETPKPVETASPASIPAPTETPAAAEPTQEPALTPAAGDILGIDYSKSPYANADALIAEYGWADVEKQHNSKIFVYSTYSYPEDWNINPDMPLSLYKYVYNVDAENRYTNASLFRTNKEVLAEKPIETINAAIKEVTERHNVMFERDYRDLKSLPKAIRRSYSPTPEVEAYIEELVKYTEDTEMVQYEAFITDPSLVYIDIDNSIRVRGAEMAYIDQSRRTEEELGVKKKTWLYAEIEFVLRTTQEVADRLGIKVWRDEPYTVYNTVDLTPDWREATPEEIALMERTVGNPVK